MLVLTEHHIHQLRNTCLASGAVCHSFMNKKYKRMFYKRNDFQTVICSVLFEVLKVTGKSKQVNFGKEFKAKSVLLHFNAFFYLFKESKSLHLV